MLARRLFQPVMMLLAAGLLSFPSLAGERGLGFVAAKKKPATAIVTTQPKAIDPEAKARFEEQLAKATAGDWYEMNAVANAYEHGDGVARDGKQALYWVQRRHDAFVKAAEAGDPEAMLNLADEYGIGSRVIMVDEAKAKQWSERRRGVFLARAEAGNTEAMEALAELLESPERDNGTADYAAALVWWRKAADAGRFSAMLRLGEKYDDGRDVPADRALAFGWYLKAAGDPLDPWNARIVLAAKYKTGDGVAKNHDEAARLHVLVAEGYGGWRKRMRAEGYADEVARSEPAYRTAVQRELAVRGLYGGAVDGQPSVALADAIKKVWRSKVKDE